jgi:hypothetical protein
MYFIIGSHFVPLEGKFLLIALVIVRITLNASNAPAIIMITLNGIVCHMSLNNGVSIVQKLVVKLSNNSTMLFSPVEVFESLTTS